MEEMSKKRKKRIKKVIKHFEDFSKPEYAECVPIPLGGDKNPEVVLNDMLERFSGDNPVEVEKEAVPKTDLPEEIQQEFETLCLQGMIALPKEMLNYPRGHQRDFYIKRLVNYFHSLEDNHQVQTSVIYYPNKKGTFESCSARTDVGGRTMREKVIADFMDLWYDKGEYIPYVKPYELPGTKKKPAVKKDLIEFRDLRTNIPMMVERSKADSFFNNPRYKLLHDPKDDKVEEQNVTKEEEPDRFGDDFDAEIASIMRINDGKKKKSEVTQNFDEELTDEQRLEIGSDLLSNKGYGLNLTDDPTKPGIWFNIFMNDAVDEVVEVTTKDLDGQEITYENRRIDYRYVPDWHWQRDYIKSFKTALKLEWIEEATSENKRRKPVLTSVYGGDYFDSHPKEVMTSEFLTKAEESMREASLETAKRITKEKKDFLAGKNRIVPEGGWTDEFVDGLLKQGYGRSMRYINYYDINSKHAYQDERLSVRRRKELEGFDLMRSTPSNCNTAKSFILAHRQLLKGARLVFDNGREFDTSPKGDMDSAFFDKVKNPLGFKSGFELYCGIVTGAAKYTGVKIPRYAGKSIVEGTSPFSKVRALERELETAETKKEIKKLKKAIKHEKKVGMKHIKKGNANMIISYEKSADWQDVYTFNPADFAEVILDESIDIDQFIDDYKEAERRKHDPNYEIPILPDEFFEKCNPTTWITPEVERRMNTKLLDSTLPEWQNGEGAKVLKQFLKDYIGDGTDPVRLEAVAKFNKVDRKTKADVKNTDKYKWAEQVSMRYHGRLSGLIRRGADADIIHGLMGVYDMAKNAYKMASLTGTKPTNKTVGDYAIDMLLEQGVLLEGDVNDDEFIDIEDILGSTSHFSEVYDKWEEDVEDDIKKIRKDLMSFRSVKKKDVGENKTKKERYDRAKKIDNLLDDNCAGGALKYKDKLLTNISLYDDLFQFSNEDVDRFMVLRDALAEKVMNMTGQPISKEFKNVKQHNLDVYHNGRSSKKIDHQVNKMRKKALKSGDINALEYITSIIDDNEEVDRYNKDRAETKKKLKEKKKKAKKKAYKEMKKQRNKALKNGTLNPLEYLKATVDEDEALAQTKKGKKLKKDAVAKSMTASAGGFSRWDEIEQRFNSKNDSMIDF